MFKSALQQISTKVEGILGVMIVGTDGIIIEQVGRPSPDTTFEVLSAEFAALLKGTLRFSQGADLGKLHELTLRTDKARLLAKFITPEYYLLLVMSPEGNYGRARHELRKAQLALESEFII